MHIMLSLDWSTFARTSLRNMKHRAVYLRQPGFLYLIRPKLLLSPVAEAPACCCCCCWFRNKSR